MGKMKQTKTKTKTTREEDEIRDQNRDRDRSGRGSGRGGRYVQTPIQSRKMLPEAVPLESRWNVWYAEQYIELGSTALSEVFQTTHSGILMRSEAVVHFDDGTIAPREMTFEYFAMYFPLGAVLPKVHDDGALEWQNDACVGYSDIIEERRWSKSQLYVGTLDGCALNAYLDWVVAYGSRQQRYQLFDVWDAPQLTSATTRYVRCSVCDSFSESSLAFMHGAGGELRQDAVLYRNYVPLLTDRTPESVDMCNEQQAQHVAAFYRAMNDAVRINQNLVDFLDTVASSMRVFYVYGDNGTYLRVRLVPPYVALGSLYQPMRDAPWIRQSKLDAMDMDASDMDAIAAAGHRLFRVSEVVNGAMRLLASRAPDIIASHAVQWLPTSAPAAVIAAIATSIAVLGMRGAATFALGFILGCAATLIVMLRYMRPAVRR